MVKCLEVISPAVSSPAVSSPAVSSPAVSSQQSVVISHQEE
ncbi:hypothetical protein QUB63_15665 [Microcoleus sp. ARI1-B5]